MSTHHNNPTPRLHELRDRVCLAWRILRARDDNTVAHARRELAGSLRRTAHEMDRAMATHLIDMVRVFSAEGHSGFSASYAAGMLAPLLRHEPLGPLTGEPEEWTTLDYGDDMQAQNNRCGHVFLRADGTAYDTEGVIFREPSGLCFQSALSRVPITFPYTPKRVYADVPLEATDEQKTEAARHALSQPEGGAA